MRSAHWIDSVHQVPEQSAVETACRYLPGGSRAGVGGDWYDVIQQAASGLQALCDTTELLETSH